MPVKKTFNIEERVKIALEDGDFNGASNAIERFLDENPTCSRAYFYKLLIEFRFKSEDDLISHGTPLDNNVNFKRALEYGSAKEKKELESINAAILERIDTAKKKLIYKDAMGDWSAHRYARAIERFESIKDFEDVASKIEECKVAWEERKRAVRYKNAITLAGEARSSKSGIAKLEKAIEILSVDPTYENSANMITNFKNRIETIKKNKKKFNVISLIVAGSIVLITSIILLVTLYIVPNNKYNDALDYLKDGKYEVAAKKFEDLDGFKDSEDFLVISETVMELEEKLYSRTSRNEAKNKAIESGFDVKVIYSAEGAELNYEQKTITNTSSSLDSNIAKKPGYTFKYWNCIDWKLNVNKKELIFYYEACFEITWFQISYVNNYSESVLENGSIVIRNFRIDSTFTLPKYYLEGYTFVGWEYTVDSTSYIINKIEPNTLYNDITLNAVFSANQRNYTMNVECGSVSLNKTNIYTDDNVILTYLPNKGHALKEAYYIIEGTSDKVKINNGNFKMPSKNIDIFVVFEPISYNIYFNGNKGEVNNMDVSVKYGESFVVDITPKDGYTITNIWYTKGYDSTKYYVNNGDVIVMGDSVLCFTVESVPNSFGIVSKPTENGSITIDNSAYVDEMVEIVIVENDGYMLSELYYVKEGTSDKVYIDFENDRASFVMPAFDIEIYSLFLESSIVTLNVDGVDKVYEVSKGTILKDVIPVEYSLENTMGYYSDENYTTWVDSTSVVNSDITLYTKVATLIYFSFNQTSRTASLNTKPMSYETVVAPAYYNGVQIASIDGGSNYYSCRYHGKRYIGMMYIPYGVTQIGTRTFECSSLRGIHIPSTVTRIGSYAFRYAYIDFSFDFNNITTINSSAFESAVFKENELLSTNNVETLGDRAFEASNIVELTGSKVTTIGKFAFYNCSSLEKITVPLIVEIDEKAFYNCSMLSEIAWGENLTTIESYAFYGCGFTNLILPDSVTLTNNSSFANNTNLESIKLPKNLKSISQYMFKGCSKLSTVVWPETLERIVIAAFENCTSLTEAILPSTIKEIQAGAFRGCTSLRKAVVVPTVDSIDMGTYSALYPSFQGCTNLEILIISSGAENLFENHNSHGYDQIKVIEYVDGKYISPNLENAFGYKIVLPIEITYIDLSSALSEAGPNIFYKGTQEQWEALEKTNYSSDYDQYIFFYSDAPIYDGQHWHYVDEIPTIYTQE